MTEHVLNVVLVTPTASHKYYYYYYYYYYYGAVDILYQYCAYE